MTTPSPQLNYATPVVGRRRGLPWFFIIMLAISIGWLATDPYGTAVAFPTDDPVPVTFHVISGLLAIGLVISAAGPFNRLISAVTQGLSGARSKPSFGICLTLILSGTACILGALAIEMHMAQAGAAVLSVVPPEAFGRGLGHVGIGFHTPLFHHVLTLLTVLAGAVLCAVGVWGSLGRTTPAMPVDPTSMSS